MPDPSFDTFTPAELLGPLNEIERKHAPDKLFIAGDTNLLREGARVSIVGSRKATSGGIARARSLARAFAGRDITVVSGLAEGVDTAAHEAAMESGGRTIAVLGTPLDRFYPAKNRGLQKRMMREQLVITQFPVGYPSQPKNFPMRNRTMALITDATVIVEAGEKSGTRHQGWEALRLGRLVFLLENLAQPGAPSWVSELTKYGAEVLSRDRLELVLDEIPVTSRGNRLAL